MFAILMTEENRSKILAHHESLSATSPIYPEEFFEAKTSYYYVREYIGERSGLLDWAALPQHVLDKHYEYDPIKIQTDWDQIVRK